jgi:hypothetical protein
MNWLLALVVLGGSPAPVHRELDVASAAQALLPELQTGSLIFCKGDCLAVRVYTMSQFTHVASVLVVDGQALVYDATSGPGVRKQPLRQFLASQDGALLHVFHPKQPLNSEQSEAFQQHLEGQLGRRYAIAHHVTGKRAEGLHCAEYATDALIASRILQAKQPARVSPASLAQGVLEGDLYRYAATVQLVSPVPRADANASWCGRMWHETKACTAACYGKLRGWLVCK